MKKASKIGSLVLLIILLMHSYTAECQLEQNAYPEANSKEWQEKHQSAPKMETMEWFQEAKFGMFIHWGIYSIPAGVWKGKRLNEMEHPWLGEWIQYTAKIPRDEYAALAREFNPVDFDPDAIARLARDAGMKYLVITSKHHDGFAMFDSKYSEFDIIDATPYGRDILEQLYESCKKYGIEFGIYYSHNIDWADGHDCQYAVIKERNDKLGKSSSKFGANLWDPSPNSFDQYLDEKAYPQVEELMQKFPDMKLIWYDMARFMLPGQSSKFYDIVYKYQPQMLVNGRIGNGYGDYIITGDNHIPETADHFNRPWEVVGTTNNSWGYLSYDEDWKSVTELLYWLVEIVSKGGNYMLNIGPKSNGEVPGQSVENLQALGKWMDINGDAIYGTKKWKVSREGPSVQVIKGTNDRRAKGFTAEFSAQDFWFTSKENTVYAMALVYPENEAIINSMMDESKIKSIRMLGSKAKLAWKLTDEGLVVELPEYKPNPDGYVLEIKLAN